MLFISRIWIEIEVFSQNIISAVFINYFQPSEEKFLGLYSYAKLFLNCMIHAGVDDTWNFENVGNNKNIFLYKCKISKNFLNFRDFYQLSAFTHYRVWLITILYIRKNCIFWDKMLGETKISKYQSNLFGSSFCICKLIFKQFHFH